MTSPTVVPVTTNAQDTGDGIDFAQLRAERRARVTAAMEAAGVDALVLGRHGNGKYVAGHRGLWRAVLGSFGPLVVFVRATQGIHLAATMWSEGVPPEIPTANLSGLTWNPRAIVGDIARIPGLADARRIAADGMSPGIATLLANVAPGSELVDGEALLREVRRVKTPLELACLRTAAALSEGAISAALAVAHVGVSEHALKGAWAQRLCSYGVTLPSAEGVVAATPRDGEPAQPPLRQRPSSRPLADGDLVAVGPTVQYAGYEVVAARTVLVGEPSSAIRALAARADVAQDAVLATLAPGARPADVAAVLTAVGEPLPPVPLLVGLGIGVEPPIVHGALADDREHDAAIVSGMVLGVQTYVWEHGIGGVLTGDTVVITETGSTVLTRLPRLTETL